MALNNKYNMEQSVVGNNHNVHSVSSAGDDPVSQSNINQNNNQGNVRQGGDGLVGLPPSFLGAHLRMNAPSSSEPSIFPANQFTFPGMDPQRHILNEQLMLMAQQQQLQRQMQGAPPPTSFPTMPMLSINPPTSVVPDHFLLEMANRARADSMHSLMNSPATSRLSDLSQDDIGRFVDMGRVITPHREKDNMAAHLLNAQQQVGTADLLMEAQRSSGNPFLRPDKEDHEVSLITSGQQHTEEDSNINFLAERKRHASAPEKLPDTKCWPQQEPGKYYMYVAVCKGVEVFYAFGSM